MSFHKQHNLFEKEEFDDKLLTMTLDEYIEYRKYHFSKVASLAFKIPDTLSNDLEYFGLKTEYYWDCKRNLDQYQTDIIELWDEFFTLMEKKSHSYETYRIELLFLAKLTRLSNISEKERDRLDTKLLNHIDRNCPQDSSIRFNEKLEYLLEWADFRLFKGYIDIMMLGVSIREVENFKYLWNNFESDFMKLRNESPTRSKNFYFIIDDYFNRFSNDMNSRFRLFYREVSVWTMTIFKNEDNSDYYSEVLIRYRRVARKTKKGSRLFWDYLLDYTTRYGEKPHLLIYYFSGFIFLFTLIYYPYPFSFFEFNNVNKGDFWLTSIINLVYFNFTTMISNSYGNISPENEITKIFVIAQQLLGLALSGGFIALFLRKMFRD